MPIQRPSGPPSRELVCGVTFYRELGFFAAAGNQTQEECAAKLLAAHRSEWDVDLVPGNSYDDAVLLSYDGKRAWFEGIECDVSREHLVYRDVLADWAHISRGAFRPRDLQETWEGAQGPIAVTFEHDGQRHALAPTWNEDALDLGILEPINAILLQSGKAFYQLRIDQTALVVALTPAERMRIEKERGWSFEGG